MEMWTNTNKINFILFNKIQTVEVSDTTGDATSTTAGNIINHFPTFALIFSTKGNIA